MATLVLAAGLMLLAESLMPLFFPARWRDLLRQIGSFKDGQLRFFGLVAMIAGLTLLLVSRLI